MERRFRALAPEQCQRGGVEPLQVFAVATRANRRWSVQLTLRRGERSVLRSLTAGSCAALAEATAVITATACPALDAEPTGATAEVGDPSAGTPDEPEDPATDLGVVAPPTALPDGPAATADLGVVAPPEPAPAGVQTPRPVLAQRDVLDPLAVVTRPRPRPGRRVPGLELAARLGVATGPTPAPALVAGAALRLQWPAVELLLALDGGPRRRVDGVRVGIDMRSATATIAGCPTAVFGSGRRRGRVSLCLGLEAGAIVGTGVGTPVTRTAAQPWLAALVGPGLTWSPSARLNLGTAVDIAASLTRPAFTLAGYDVAYRAPATSVRLRIFLGVQLW